jgi:hypothetical protein
MIGYSKLDTYLDLVIGGRKNELVANLKVDQQTEILELMKELYSKTTVSRRESKCYKMGDYYFYFTTENDTAYNISEKLEVENIKLEYHSKLLLNVNKIFMKNLTQSDIRKFNTLKFMKDTLILLPYANPDTYISEIRTSIPGWIRNKVWELNSNPLTNIANCYVCNCDVYNESYGWDCSHIIPWCICYLHEVENLKVCCQSCNRKCGIRNLNDYKEEYLINQE